MTEQQQHLVNLLNQRSELSKEFQTLQGEMNSKRELFFKVQGAIEYLQQIGVTLPEPIDESNEEESVDEENTY